MRKYLVHLEQRTYGFEFDEVNEILYYDGEEIAKLNEHDEIVMNDVTYAKGDIEEVAMTILSSSENLLKDFIETNFGTDFQSLQTFATVFQDYLDLSSIFENVHVVEQLEEDDKLEVYSLFGENVDLIHYDGEYFEKIDERMLNYFISEIHWAFVGYSDNRLAYTDIAL